MTTPAGPLTLTDVQTEFGGSNPISMSEYYRGGVNVPSGQTTSPVDGVPISTSGEIRMGMFRSVTKVSGAMTAGFNPDSIAALIAGNFNASGSVSASLTLQSDGSTTGSTTPITDTSEYSNWGTPITPGGGASYWVRVTATSGTFTTGTTGSWLSMSTNRTWTKSTTGSGNATVFFTVEFATDAAGSNIVYTKTGNYLSYVHNYVV